MHHSRKLSVTVLALALLGSGCSELQQLIQIQRPALHVAGMRITGLSLQEAALAFDIDIENPNPVSVSMAGFDYQFQINGNEFLKGTRDEKLAISANGKSRVAVPVTLTFSRLYQTYTSLRDLDSTAYTLACGFTFDLPVLGPARIPVQKSGHLPLVKLPKIGIQSLKLNKMSFTGADLTLALKLNNPNAFQLLISRLNYHFRINGMNWAEGSLTDALTVRPKGQNLIQIPVSLNFLDMGKTVLQLVQGNQDLQYGLEGAVDFNTSLPALQQVSLPLNSSGAIKIMK